MIRRLLSYIIPINIYREKSSLSRSLEVTWADGKLVLDSGNTNYSYGSLQRILRNGLNRIGFDKIRNMQNILVLGVAGGSVIRTISGEIGYKGKITGVEIDEKVLGIAKKYFSLADIPNLNLIVADANHFVKSCEKKFDLVVIDIFADSVMPEFLFEDKFIESTIALLHPDGYILFNTMATDGQQEVRNEIYIKKLHDRSLTVNKTGKLERFNELIIAQKPKTNSSS